MPSDKPIFFKPEDYVCDDDYIQARLLNEMNEKVAPLLQAMEIMRIALKRIEFPGDDHYRATALEKTYERVAREALEKCDEILK